MTNPLPGQVARTCNAQAFCDAWSALQGPAATPWLHGFFGTVMGTGSGRYCLTKGYNSSGSLMTSTYGSMGAGNYGACEVFICENVEALNQWSNPLVNHSTLGVPTGGPYENEVGTINGRLPTVIQFRNTKLP